MKFARAAAGGLAIAASLMVPTAAPASARDSDCSVRVDDHTFVDGSHIHLHSNRAAVVTVTAPVERPHYKVDIELAGARYTVGSGRGRDFGWKRALDIGHASKFGVGVYKLHVETTVGRNTCEVVGLIEIAGRSPLTTVAGGAAALAALIGIIGLLASLFRRGGRPLRTRHGFSVEDPLGQFVAVDTPGNYVGWVEVACDVGARTFVTTKTTAADVRGFFEQVGTRARLTDIRAKGVRVRADDTKGDVPRVRWQPRVYALAPILGVIGGIAGIAYMQQANGLYVTPIDLGIAAASGIGAGLVIANLARLFATIGLNRRLKAAARGLEHEEEVEPRYPPIDHLDELDTFVWTPTHSVPENGTGLPAWDEPDRSKEKAATLDPGLPVRVVERRDGLAQVVCSNGWVGWTEAEPLQELDA